MRNAWGLMGLFLVGCGGEVETSATEEPDWAICASDCGSPVGRWEFVEAAIGDGGGSARLSATNGVTCVGRVSTSSTFTGELEFEAGGVVWIEYEELLVAVTETYPLECLNRAKWKCRWLNSDLSICKEVGEACACQSELRFSYRDEGSYRVDGCRLYLGEEELEFCRSGGWMRADNEEMHLLMREAR